MGVDIHVYMGYRGEEVTLYRKCSNDPDKLVETTFYMGRNSALFEFLKEHGYTIDKTSMPEDIKQHYEEEADWCYGFREITLADLKLLIIDTKVKLEKADCDERIFELTEISDALIDFFNKASAYFDFWNRDYAVPLSAVTIYYWFDN